MLRGRKQLQANHTRGGIVLKQKISFNLKNLGYDFSLIQDVISSYSFPSDNLIAKKEYEKIIHKYSKKYCGEELERRVKQYLYRKGLIYEE